MAQKFLTEITLQALNNATTDTDKFLVSDSGTIKFRTGAEVLSDIGGQASLTNPVTGTGTTNYVPKFTGSTTIGNSQIFDNGTNVLIGTSTDDNYAKLKVSGGSIIINNNQQFNSYKANGLPLAIFKVDTADKLVFNPLWGQGLSGYSFTISGSEKMSISTGGSVTASGDFRAPIFYDSDNTGYYVDPSSQSNLNTVYANSFVKYGGTSAQYLMADGSVSTGPSLTGYVPTSRTLTINGVTYDLSANRSWTVSAGATDFNALTNKTGGTGTYQTSGDFRAPIFYDSNDTGYYIDPNTTGTSGYFAGVLRQNNGNYVRDSYYRTYSGRSDYYTSGTAGWYTAATVTLTGNCSGAVIYGTLYDNRYDGADTYQIAVVARAECDFTSNNQSHYVNVGCTILGSTNNTDYRNKIRLILVTSSTNIRTYELQFYETAWNNDTWQLESTGWTIYTTGQAPGSAVGTPVVNYISTQNADYQRANISSYSPTYYDYDNTGYYLNPASTSNIVGLTVANTISGNISGGASYAANLSGTINASTSGISSMKYNDTRYWVTDPNAPGNYFQAITLGNGTDFTQIGVNSSNSMYFRFNGTGNTWYNVLSSNNYSSYAVPLTRTLTINGTTYDLSADRSWTVTAVETDTLQTVTGRGNTTSNGLIATASESREVSTYFPSSYGINDLVSGHNYKWYSDIWRLGATRSGGAAAADFVIQFNGSNKINLSTSGNLTASADMRAPIFYDSNDTLYYVDAANSTTAVNVKGKVVVNIGSSTSSTILQMVSTSGSPSINSYYGVLNTSGDFYIGAPASSGNNLYGNNAYFSIFYDRNNSAYYVDPTSTSNIVGLTVTNTISGNISGNAGTVSTITNRTNLMVNSLAAPALIDGLTTANFRSTLFGTTSNGYQISTARWNNVPGPLSGLNAYGTMIAWAGSDTQGFLAVDYTAAAAKIGGGNGNNVNWSRSVLLEDTWLNSKYFGSGGQIYTSIYYDANDSSFYFDGADTGDSIRCAGDIVAYYSDERLKDRKGNIENALDKVLSLNGFYYEPNEVAQALGYKKKLEVGVSAQEVQAILPEIIKDAPIGGDYKTLDYGRLTPLLIEAIKEQQTQIDVLKELVNKLINK